MPLLPGLAPPNYATIGAVPMITKTLPLLALATSALYAAAPAPGGGRFEPFEELELTFEVNVNDVDGEVILHAETGKPLERVALVDPYGQLTYALRTGEGGIGLTEFRLESGEPSIDLVRTAYPEGEYTVTGVALDGTMIRGVVDLEHAIPARCWIMAPESMSVVDRNSVTIQWQTDPSVEKFTVELEDDDDEERLAVNLPGDATSFRVPEGLLEPETEYQIVLVSHSDSGNRTVQEIYFTTAP